MYQRPKGTSDILPGESEKWQWIEEKARNLFKKYQYREIRTPLFEHYEVISRSVGDTTDIVSKEMYDFYDKGDRHITLRPEGTAPVARAYVENKLYGPEHTKPYKLYYMGPMYRYERPQSGRQREFHQIGVEVFGAENPAVDVEVMVLALDFYRELGIKHLRLLINSLGDKASRARYRQALIDYLEPHLAELSQDSQNRWQNNPLRVLDSKDEKDKKIVAEAPSILDFLGEEAKTHFTTVCQLLDKLDIPYDIDTSMVRGLDYYNHTIFEIVSDAPGFGGVLTTVCGGGRYNGLVEELGGPEVPGIGFAMGVERVLITLEAEGIALPVAEPLHAYVVGIGAETNGESLKLTHAIRKQGFKAERDYLERKPKAQFKAANKLNAELVITLGADELEKGTAKIKNMKTAEESEVALTEIYQAFAQLYPTLTKPKI